MTNMPCGNTSCHRSLYNTYYPACDMCVYRGTVTATSVFVTPYVDRDTRGWLFEECAS